MNKRIRGSIRKSIRGLTRKKKVCREELWECLQRYGVSGHLLRAIKAMHQASVACVRVDGVMSDWIEVKQGVRQGCPMLPWLFNIFLDMVVRV